VLLTLWGGGNCLTGIVAKLCIEWRSEVVLDGGLVKVQGVGLLGEGSCC